MVALCTEVRSFAIPSISSRNRKKISKYRQYMELAKENIEEWDNNPNLSRRHSELYEECANTMFNLGQIGNDLMACQNTFPKSPLIQSELKKIQQNGNELYKMCSGRIVNLWSPRGRSARALVVNAQPRSIGRKRSSEPVWDKDLERPTWFM